MRRFCHLIRWTSIVLFVLAVAMLLFGISMRGMIHSNPRPSVWSMCLDMTPPIAFFAYLFCFTYLKRLSLLCMVTGIGVVGWLLWWLAFSRFLGPRTEVAFFITCFVFAPFLFYLFHSAFFRESK
jgi:hypothetical protein